jgi:hypothetical protein
MPAASVKENDPQIAPNLEKRTGIAPRLPSKAAGRRRQSRANSPHNVSLRRITADTNIGGD